jgi:hypothetical protein
MNASTTLSVMGIILGLFGLGWFWGWLYEILFRRRPAVRIMRLGIKTPLDVIAPANITVPGDHHEAAAYMTSVGDLRAIAIASRFLSTFYRKKSTKIYIGTGPGHPDGDRLLIGSDLHNQATVGFLSAFEDIYDVEVVVDVQKRMVAVGEERIEDFDHRWISSDIYKGDLPTRDLAVVVLAPWARGDRRRVILCAGLTTYGTEGAASFAFDHLWTNNEHKPLRSALRGAEAAVIALQIWVDNGEAAGTEVAYYLVWGAHHALTTKGGSGFVRMVRSH